MEESFVKNLARNVFASIERDNPAILEKTHHMIASEYANNEISLLISIMERLEKSNTIQDRNIMKRLQVIERELLDIADELAMKVKE